MRSWRKFIFIPLIIWLIWSAMLWSFDIQKLAYSYYDASITILAWIPLIAMPYVMLKYAPRYPYIATLIYMLILKCLIILVNAQLDFNEIRILNLYDSLIFSAIAMLIYSLRHTDRISQHSVH